MAASVCSCIRDVSEPFAPSSRPAVSMMVKARSPSLPSPSRRSRVTPGRSSTSASFCPTSRLNSVDLPTLGRPIMAIVNDMERFQAPVLPRLSMRREIILARETAAWQRRRECGLLLLRRLGLLLLRLRIGRRRGGTAADDLLLRWRRRSGYAVFLGRRCIRISCRCRLHGGLLRFALRLRGLRTRRRFERRGRGGRVLLVD